MGELPLTWDTKCIYSTFKLDHSHVPHKKFESPN